jgi:type IV secretory pathway TraG/TraD family ATPase VirD4
MLSRSAGHGIYIGTTGGKAVFGAPEEAMLVLGPPRSGKTSSLVVPNVLAAAGPVLVASTKRDVIDQTTAARRRLGACGIFDPSGEISIPEGVAPVGWSPIDASRTYDGAVHVAESMVDVARGGGRAEESHWNERAGALLASLFHAGSRDEVGIREVVSWVDRRDPKPALAILARSDAVRATEVLRGISDTESRELSGIWSTTSGVLSAYRTEAALRSAEGARLDAVKFVNDGGAHTLYVCASGRQQRHAAPIIAGLLREIRDATYLRAAELSAALRAGAPIHRPPPVLAVLDEMANIAPLRDLPAMVSEGGSQGLLVLGCLQDLSQARARWGHEADGFFSLFGTKIILPGIGDVRTLEAVSALCGEKQVTLRSATAGPALATLTGRGRAASMTVSTRTQRRVPVDAIAAGRPGMGFVLDSKGKCGFEGLTPSHQSLPWREVNGQAARARSWWLSQSGRSFADRSGVAPVDRRAGERRLTRNL